MWRKINGFDYEVSDLGEVRNSNGQMLNKHLTNYGYYQVKIDGKYKLVHRLVAEAFIDNPNNHSVVDHIDRNRQNNSVSNLRWVSQSDNLKNSTSMSRSGSYKVDQYDLEDNYIQTWKNASEAAKLLNLKQQSISSCCNGKLKSTGGYRWKKHITPVAAPTNQVKERAKVVHSSDFIQKQSAKKNDKLEQYKADYYGGMELKDLRTKYGYKFVANNPLEFKTTRGYNRLINAILNSNE